MQHAAAPEDAGPTSPGSGSVTMVAFVASMLVAALVYLHGRATLFDPALLPGHDGAGYIQRGLYIRDALAAHDGGALWERLVRPDIRPPGFPLVLGSYQLWRGDDFATAIEWSAVAYFAGLASLFALGVAVDRRRGWIAGAAAIVLTAGGLDHVAMTFFPMSETTTFLATVLATIGVAILAPRPGVLSAAGVGVLLLAAALVRYNLPFPLIAALIADRMWTCRRAPGSFFRFAPVLWVAPLVTVFGIWQLLRPNLSDVIRKFLVNRSSGLEFWSSENLLFVPRTIVEDYLSQPWVAGPVILAFLAGVLPSLLDAHRTVSMGPCSWTFSPSRSLRIVQLEVLATTAALTLHDYKVERNLYAILPLLYVCAVAPWTGLSLPRMRWLPGALLAAALGATTLVQTARGLPTLADRYHFKADPTVAQALDFIAKNAGVTPRLWLTGSNDAVSPPLIELWLRKAGKGQVDLNSAADPQTPRTRTGIDPAWNEGYTTVVHDRMLIEKELRRCTWITLETLAGSHRFNGGQRWTNYQNNYARAFREQDTVPEVDRVVLEAGGMSLRAYVPGGAALAADTTPIAAPVPLAAAQAPTAPELPVGGAEGYVEDFAGGTGNWRVVGPASVADRMQAQDGRLVVVLNEAARHLQVCSPPIQTSGQLHIVIDVEIANVGGRPVAVQIRGLTETGAINRVGEKGDLHRVGPMRKNGLATIAQDVTLAEGSVASRACLVLDDATGEFRLDRFAMTPRP